MNFTSGTVNDCALPTCAPEPPMSAILDETGNMLSDAVNMLAKINVHICGDPGIEPPHSEPKCMVDAVKLMNDTARAIVRQTEQIAKRLGI